MDQENKSLYFLSDHGNYKVISDDGHIRRIIDDIEVPELLSQKNQPVSTLESISYDGDWRCSDEPIEDLLKYGDVLAKIKTNSFRTNILVLSPAEMSKELEIL